MFKLDNKTAIVTGGGSGIGRAISILFARQGAEVHILDFDKTGADQVVQEIKAANGMAIAHQCDVSNQHQVKEIIDGIGAAKGSIELLINNAGVAHVGTVETTGEEDETKRWRYP
jgi:2-keto-3-deoxy-L-fuconate dehydrogenase